MEFKHISVLLEETIEGLNIKPEGIYVDGTLGGGGHAIEICKRLDENGKLIGLDQDEEAIKASTIRLNEYKSIVSLNKSNFMYMAEVLNKENIKGVDGIVLDLGVSSHQIDRIERGFSYNSDAPLDMRMDRDQPKTAKDIVNDYDEEKLYRIIKDYGEERFAKSIARNIVKERTNGVIETTTELVEIIKKSMPAKARYASGHPAKRTFQAIRIELNKELEVLKETLNTMVDLLNEKGRICIITFHSLEDRIVKNIFRDNEHPCTCPREFPICVCNKKSKGKVITRKPILPSEDEMEFNTRAKSAKLRIFERV
ncbi:16S rRNA (cytosine1402-N4)-methyltransferase [Natranaerovirga pectinivora]|uniref:Ribosomal RNA small subunit methyltransferase H n=1 Tax=Natranaerovirga pectinivora TaxID=682400 RepID=A0A4R3MRM9_9FIRM|nr:16S rRNA (cytosine(1402)-N(4))-methyltransferase RsmH [Natranaerovirga pectinivora]TCT16848.1 16S rRNA (cytosine1402-N4)-methyltransferase [Natranaerovirga pectinivora]